MSDKESVIASPAITVHTLRKKWEIKIVSALSLQDSLQYSLAPWSPDAAWLTKGLR